jgi:glucan 1,3-beta-glucosidase
MLYVGYPNDVGIVEMTDLLFTSVGNLPGLVLMQWNVIGSPQAGAALWGKLIAILVMTKAK